MSAGVGSALGIVGVVGIVGAGDGSAGVSAAATGVGGAGAAGWAAGGCSQPAERRPKEIRATKGAGETKNRMESDSKEPRRGDTREIAYRRYVLGAKVVLIRAVRRAFGKKIARPRRPNGVCPTKKVGLY
jgi:hypothetical protein